MVLLEFDRIIVCVKRNQTMDQSKHTVGEKTSSFSYTHFSLEFYGNKIFIWVHLHLHLQIKYDVWLVSRL